MDRIYGPTVSVNENGTGRAGFRAGSLELMIPTTQLTPDWFNQVQEEIARVNEKLGVVLNPADKEQLSKAIYGTRVASFVGPVNDAVMFQPSDWSTCHICNIFPEDGSNGVIHGFGSNVLVGRKIIRCIGNPITIKYRSSLAAAGNDVENQQSLDLVVRPGEFCEIFLGENYWFMISHGALPPTRFDLRLCNVNPPHFALNTEATYYDATGKFPEQRRRVVMLSPLSGMGKTWDCGTASVGDLATTATNAAIICYPIKLDYGSALTRVRVGVVSSGSTAGVWVLDVYQNTVDKTAPFSSGAVLLGSVNLSGSGHHILDTSASVFANADNDISSIYLNIIAPSDAATGGAAIYWIELTYDDAGPRNY